MRWQGRQQSKNVEDRRGIPATTMAVGGGIGTLVLVLVVALLGGDPRALLQQMPPPAANQAPGPRPVNPVEQPLKEFVSVVPDSFTHGTSAQRARWFRLGLQTGDASLGKRLFELPEEQL